MHKSTTMDTNSRTTKELQNKSTQRKFNKKVNFLSPLAKEKSNITYTGATILRKKQG